jgi:hypothetical protein
LSEWWTYRLADLALFSERTYHRLFELYNEAIWPLQWLALGIGAALLLPAVRRRPRLAWALVAACWAWVAIAFHWQRYATIHLAGPWFAGLFVLEALLLAWWSVMRRPLAPASGAGLLVFTFALVGMPLLGPLALGRSWSAIQLFGTAPDPTAVGSLGLAVMSGAPRRWPLAVAPALWCVVAGATLRGIDEPTFWVAPVAGLAALCLLVATRSSPRRSGPAERARSATP